MANCPKCGVEAGCPCGWGIAADGNKYCSACVAASHTQQGAQLQTPVNNYPLGMQLQEITYQHNYL